MRLECPVEIGEVLEPAAGSDAQHRVIRCVQGFGSGIEPVFLEKSNEALPGHLPEPAHKMALAAPAGFGGVLNQNQLVAAGNVQQAGHIGHIAKHMHHAQRAHAGTGFVIVQPVLFQGAVVGTKILHGVRVNAKGVVAAKKKGKVTIKVIMKSGATAKCKIIVKK